VLRTERTAGADADELARLVQEVEALMARRDFLERKLQEEVDDRVEWLGETVASLSWTAANLEALQRATHRLERQPRLAALVGR
jgi:hypothetical protein